MYVRVLLIPNELPCVPRYRFDDGRHPTPPSRVRHPRQPDPIKAIINLLIRRTGCPYVGVQTLDKRAEGAADEVGERGPAVGYPPTCGVPEK